MGPVYFNPLPPPTGQAVAVDTGAAERIRTFTPEGTGLSDRRVYHFTTTAKWYQRRESNPHATRTLGLESSASTVPPLWHNWWGT